MILRFCWWKRSKYCTWKLIVRNSALFGTGAVYPTRHFLLPFWFFNLPLTAHKIMTPLEMFPLPQTSWTLLNCKIKNLLIIRRSQLQYSTLHQPQSTNSIIINIFNLTPLLPPHSPNVFLFTAVLIELKLTSKKKSSLDENTNDKNKNQNYTSSEQKSRSKN